MKIKVNDSNVKKIVRYEVRRLNYLIKMKAVKVNEINLNHIDISEVKDLSNLFQNINLEKPLNIKSWNFVKCEIALNIWNNKSIHVNPNLWKP